MSRGRWEGTPQFLEVTSPAQIAQTRAKMTELLEVHWKFFQELAYQRSLIQQPLRDSLTQRSASFSFDNWQRCVRYQYSLHPLCAVGSFTAPGGRFNFGRDIKSSQFPIFSALYLATNKSTAMSEALGTEPKDGLSAMDLALANPASISLVAVDGRLDTVFDLRQQANLKGLIDLVKNFTLSAQLQKEAKRLTGKRLQLATTVPKLHEVLLRSDWRIEPVQWEVPATCQVFGQIAFDAGIEGIVYPSKRTGDDCLAIYPRNLSPDSFVRVRDATPSANVPVSITARNWRLAEQTYDEVMATGLPS